MHSTKSALRSSFPPASVLLALGSLALSSATPAQAQGNAFANTVLVANRPEYNPVAFVDPYLINPWGIAIRPPGIGGHIWVSNAGNASSTTYIGDVNGTPLYQDGLKVVPLEGPLVSFEDGLANVTGQVYNAASDIVGQPVEFLVSGAASDLRSGTPVPIGTVSGSSKFIFVTTDGTINAWRSGTAASMDLAVLTKDYSLLGADRIQSLPYLPAFTGVALTTDPFTLDSGNNPVADNRLYVADFQNNTIRVINNQWQDITSSVTFERPPGMRADYSPFNIQYLGGKIYVAYAVVDPSAEEPATDVADVGAGHVITYDRDGHIIQEFADTGVLNSPWGLALAPEGFGDFGGDLLVANFGDGSVSALDADTGVFHDFLRDENGDIISIDGIWGLTFGNGVALGDANALYYTAGPNSEVDGVLGRLTVVPEPASTLLLLSSLGLLATRRRRMRTA